MNHEFADPTAFWLLLVVPLVWWRQRRVWAADGAALPHPLAGATTVRWARLGPDLHFLLWLLPFLLFVVALARPQSVQAGEEQVTVGVDIILALDISGSMDARDFQPRNRLEVAKAVAADFIAGRPGDRIGLVTFAGQAVTRCPLTIDQTVLQDILAGSALGDLPDGTALGNALATSVHRLEGSPARSRVAILVTDGVNNTGEIDPLTAAEIARSLGVRVHTVAVGRRGPVPFPVRDPRTGRTVLREMAVDVDEETLGRIADHTGGRHFRATDPRVLAGIFEQIDAMEKSEVHVHRWRTASEGFAPWLSAGLGALLVGVLLGQTLLRRWP